jgi:hypothetical protein
MKTSVTRVHIAEIEYLGYLKPEMVSLYPHRIEVPVEYKEAVEEFLREHGYLTHQTITEFSTKGHSYLTIYGAW